MSESDSLRIAVIADTHGIFPSTLGNEIAQADEIWHLGDVCDDKVLQKIRQIGPPVLVVKGNNDIREPWPPELFLERRGVRFRLIHIPPPLNKLGDTDILLHGHTHVPRDEIMNGVRVLNPGTVGKPNHGAPPSYAWLTVSPIGELDWRIVPLNHTIPSRG